MSQAQKASEAILQHCSRESEKIRELSVKARYFEERSAMFEEELRDLKRKTAFSEEQFNEERSILRHQIKNLEIESRLLDLSLGSNILEIESLQKAANISDDDEQHHDENQYGYNQNYGYAQYYYR
jgi:hypothetical protein